MSHVLLHAGAIKFTDALKLGILKIYHHIAITLLITPQFRIYFFSRAAFFLSKKGLRKKKMNKKPE